jgi:cytoskeletal protein CcmA (bactofilin family)
MAKYNNDVENKAINLLGAGTEITGDIVSDGDIRIDGTLIGNLTTKGKVVLGETGRVKGEIFCKNSDVSGEIEGKITVSELLSLKVTSKVTGDMQTNRLSIEPGSKFTGNCNMGGSSLSYGFEESNSKEKQPEPAAAEEKAAK